MPEDPFSLIDFLTKKIAEDLGIQPGQVTTEFVHELRKRMYRDPTPVEPEQWKQKCRMWAQEVIQQGVTPCT